MWTRPSLPGKNRDERTEVHQARDRTEVRFADLHYFGQRFDHRFGLFRRRRRRATR